MLKEKKKRTGMNYVYRIQNDLCVSLDGKTVLHFRDGNMYSILVGDSLHIPDLLGQIVRI